MGAQYFSANPDRRRRLYNTPLGMYSPGCGLANVYMSWGAPEYLYLVLELNRVPLPAEAMFIIRNHKFAALTRRAPGGGGGGGAPGGGSCYLPLCSDEDRALLPLLASFQELAAWRPAGRPPMWPPGFTPLAGEALMAHYRGLVAQYVGPGKLQW
jgi:inositol oxygenase